MRPVLVSIVVFASTLVPLATVSTASAQDDGRISVRLDGEPGLSVSLSSGPSASRRRTLPIVPGCTAPCSGRLMPGWYAFGLSRPGHDPVGAGRLEITGDTLLVARYEDRSAVRTAGGVMLAPSLAMIVVGLAYGIAADATRDHGWHDGYHAFGEPDDILVCALVAGTGAILSLVSAGLLGLNDHASVRIQPTGIAF